MALEPIEVIALEEDRIDKCLASELPDLSRSQIQRMIKEDKITLNGDVTKSNARVQVGDSILISIDEPIPLTLEPWDYPLSILYEDEDLLIVDKPKNMVVHPAPGHLKETLTNAVLFHCKGTLSGINGIMRPGIVHRIDKDTTGSLVICKNDRAHQALSEQFQNHTIKRVYHAIVIGNLQEDFGTVDSVIGRSQRDRKKMSTNTKSGKRAVTHYEVLKRFGKYTYISCQLETGRTHQIRVHMASLHHPVLGDTTYGPLKQPMKLEGQVLHAKTIGFIHPVTKQYIEYDAPLPQYFEKILKKLDDSPK